MKNKKSQAALEFLMTYGWAILVVLVVIGTLAYFGVLNPAKLLPEKCTMQMGFYCRDHHISMDFKQVSLRLENGLGKGLIVTRIKIGDEGDAPILCNMGIDDNSTYWETAKSGVFDYNDVWQQNASYIYNSKRGWFIKNGDYDDITINCSKFELVEGKIKVALALVYFYSDSTEKFLHTMHGDLLAQVETTNI